MGRAWGDIARGAGYEDQFFRRSLEDHPGLVVEHLDFMAKIAQRGQADMSRILWRRVIESRPDMVFLVPFAGWAGPLRETVRRITECTAAKTVLWVCDDPWQFEDFSSKWAPCVDHIITTDPGMLSAYRAIGCEDRLIISQWGVNTSIYTPASVEQDIAVSFVGHAHSDRQATIQAIEDKGIPVQVFGRGWGNRAARLSDAEMIDVFRRSKINLNLGLSIDSSCQQIKARNFEVLASGGFLITQRVPYLDRYCEDGRELVMYDHCSEIPQLIGQYLNENEKRAEIARRGAERCRREHDWQHRFVAIFDAIGFDPLGPRQRSSSPQRVQLGA
jgi:spore maturation protein CgeB